MNFNGSVRCVWQPVTANIWSSITMFWPDQNKISAYFWNASRGKQTLLVAQNCFFLQMSGIEWNWIFDIKYASKIKIKKSQNLSHLAFEQI